MRWRTCVMIALLSVQRAAFACVVCDSKTGHQLRRGILDGHFLTNLTALAAPFPVFLAIAALLYFRFPLPLSYARIDGEAESSARKGGNLA